MDATDFVGLLARLGLFGGVLALGVALGGTLALQELQQMCIAVGELPAPGTPIEPRTLQALPCYRSAQTLQTIANTAAKAGAILLLGGGVLERFEGPLAEQLAARLEVVR
jgi:hypothetical protein